jgi:DNA-binding beta-propeller fold protein YncE
VSLDSRFLYVVNLRSDSISIFALDPSPASRRPPAASPPAPSRPTSRLDPTGRYAYVVDSGDDTVRAFTRNAQTGNLKPVGTPRGAGERPVALELDTTGEHLYAVDLDGNGLWAYDVDVETGALAAGRELRSREASAGDGDPARRRSGLAQPHALRLRRHSGSGDISAYATNPGQRRAAGRVAEHPRGQRPALAGRRPARTRRVCDRRRDQRPC